MIIAVRKEQNDTIYIDKEIFYRVDNKGLFVFEEERLSQPPYNFKKIIISDDYSDCSGEDFNEDLTFSVEKYNVRKQRESATARIVELKQLLEDTDYKALKYAEGAISAIDYLPIQRERQAWRDEINDLENLTK